MKAMKTIEERKANYLRIESLVEQVPSSNFMYAFEKSYKAAADFLTLMTGEKATATQVSDWYNDWYDLAMAKEI